MSYTSDPAKYAADVTPSNSTVLTPTRGLYVAVTGSLVVQMYGNDAIVTLANAAVGYHPLQVSKVMAATTASGIVALW
jgi:hypothetical protein